MFGSQPSNLACLPIALHLTQSSSDLHELNEQLNAEFGGSGGGGGGLMSEAERERLEALYEERIQLSKAALQEAMVAAATELAAMREQVHA